MSVVNLVRSSLTKKVALLFIGLTFVLIMFINVSYFVYFRTTIKESLTNALDLVISSSADNMDRLFMRMQLMIDNMEGENSNFANHLMEFDDDLVVDITRYRQFESEIRRHLEISLTPVMTYYGATFFVDDAVPLAQLFPNVYEGIFSVRNYYYAPPVMSSSVDAQNDDWYIKTIDSHGDAYWFKSPENNNMLYMAKALYAFMEAEASYRRLGVFLIALDISQLTKSLDMSNLTTGTVIILSDMNEQLIYTSSLSEEPNNTIGDVRSELLESGRHVEYHHQLHGGLVLTTLVPETDINEIVNGQFVILIRFTVIMTFAVVLLVIYISRIIVGPIVKLSRHMRGNEQLQTIKYAENRADEIGLIYRNYNTLMEQMSVLIQEIYEKAEMEKESRLKMLQAQINPHFIYNTLDSICCISLMRQQEDVAEILSRLANLIRYNITEPDAMISVQQELDQINDYVHIQTFRVGNKIELKTHTNSNLEKLLIPKMIIQPLVENSLFHAVEYLDSEVLKVDISFFVEADLLTIKVQDNGNYQFVDRINQHLLGNITISQSNGGFGIRNINQRIKMKFGDSSLLFYEKAENSGTRAVIIIPKIEK